MIENAGIDYKERILKHLQSRLPNATEMQLEKIIKG